MEGEQLSLFSQGNEHIEDFFKRKRNWSASKHRILLRYIQAHCYTLGGEKSYQSKHLNYVDGFAGTGRYKQGIGIEDFVGNSNFWTKTYKHNFENTDGSPLIALKCAKLFLEEGRVNLRCFFIEANSKSNQQLQENCRDLGQGIDYTIYQPQTFENAFPDILTDLNNYPTLFFLDTFGVKGVTFEQICQIGNYVSQYKGELFLLFHNRQVARHAGQYKLDYQNTQQKKVADNYTNNLTKLLGINSKNDWQTKWIELQSQPQQFERWALEYFKEKMRKEAGFKGVTSFEIKETYTDSRPQYSIVVGSNHPQKAFGVFLNDFIWDEERFLFFQDSHTGIHKFLEKEWNSENRKRISEIKPQAMEFLQQIKCSKYDISFEEAITHIILSMSDIGRLKRSQYYKDILMAFYKEGLLQVTNLNSKNQCTLKSLLRIKD